MKLKTDEDLFIDELANYLDLAYLDKLNMLKDSLCLLVNKECSNFDNEQLHNLSNDIIISEALLDMKYSSSEIVILRDLMNKQCLTEQIRIMLIHSNINMNNRESVKMSISTILSILVASKEHNITIGKL